MASAEKVVNTGKVLDAIETSCASKIECSKLQKLCNFCKLQKLPTTQGWNQSIHKGDLAKGH